MQQIAMPTKHLKLKTITPQHYSPFGMVTPGRSLSAGDGYRFGFNGQEQVDEVYGNGKLNTAEYWEYDTRIGKRWNIDPITNSKESPYATFRGNPIILSDIDGDCPDCKHKTVKGDTYGKLAKQYNVSVSQLRAWNGYKDTEIPIGIDLIISDPYVIAKSTNVPGIGEDFGSGTLSLDEAAARIGATTALVDRQNWSDAELKKDMNDLGRKFADGENSEQMVKGVFYHFYSGEGTPYSNELLTNSAISHPSVLRFVYNQIAPTFQKLVLEHSGFKPNGTFDLRLEGNPRFNETAFMGIGNGDEDNGLRISINDVHAYQVKVIDYKELGAKYTATIELTLYDHFGLNDSDFTEHNYSSFYSGFYSWYILQWQRNYPAFITTVTMNFNISGNIK